MQLLADGKNGRLTIAPAGLPRLRLAPAHPRDVLSDPLSDRGMIGDDVIELKKIRQWVEAAGFDGYAEVETFSAMDWRPRTGEATLDTGIARHRSVV